VSDYRVELLADHSRAGFISGSAELDQYFRERVGQDVRRRVATCFVLIGPEQEIAGYYTLAATSLAFDSLPPERVKKLPRYPVIPAILLGRLAVSSNHQGLGLGAALVADAVMRSSRSDITGYAVVVDAKDEAADRFYRHLGFIALSGRRLIQLL
jgi:GNAT superfamily N-acetyltransferase